MSIYSASKHTHIHILIRTHHTIGVANKKGRKPVEKKGKSCSAIKIISNPYSTPQSSSIYIHLAKLSPNVRVSEWKKGKNTPLTTHQVPFTTHNNNKMAIYNHPNLFKAIFEKSSK